VTDRKGQDFVYEFKEDYKNKYGIAASYSKDFHEKLLKKLR